MHIKNYLDSTYLKTADQASISEAENKKIVVSTIEEAIEEQFKLVMIRPEYVALAKNMVTVSHAKVKVGTVISFPEGTHVHSQFGQRLAHPVCGVLAAHHRHQHGLHDGDGLPHGLR